MHPLRKWILKSQEYLSVDLEPTEGEMIPQIKPAWWHLIVIIFPWECLCLCASPCLPEVTNDNSAIQSLNKDFRMRGRSHMNIYQGGEPYPGKIIPTKLHCACFSCGIYYAIASLVFRRFSCVLPKYINTEVFQSWFILSNSKSLALAF